MSDINTTTTGQAFGGLSGGALFDLFGLGAKAEPVGTFVDPRFQLPSDDLALAKDQQRVQAEIDAATARGEQPSGLLFAQLETIESQRDLLNRQFLIEQQQQPGVFHAAGVAPGTPLSFFINLFNLARSGFEALTGGPGQPAVGVGAVTRPPGASPRLPGVGGDPGAFGFPSRRPAPTAGPATPPASRGFDVNRFIQCLVGSLLPSQTGGQRMPFQISAGPQASSGGFDFGGFLGGALDIAKRFLGPTVGPGTAFPGGGIINQPQQAGFPLLAPFTRALPAVRRALPAIGAGFAGSGLEEFFFGGNGGAGTLDETAAFTDPIPGSCRPKMHVKTNPCTGKGVWFVPRGRPLVFSGDLSAARRLDRVAKTLDKARPRKRHHHHTTSHRRPR